MKKSIFLLTTYLFFSAVLIAQTYIPNDGLSAVKFSIKNFGLNVAGSFKGIQGKIKFTPTNLSASSFLITLDATSINTGNKSRDGHLRKDTYFDVDKYDKLQFVSTKILSSSKSNEYIMEGLLTIKGVAKTILFPFYATLTTNGYLFKGSFKINRRDFNVGENSLVLSDMLTVSLSIIANK